MITAFSVGGANISLTWNSVLTREYRIQKASDMDSPAWIDSGLGIIAPTGPSTSHLFSDPSITNMFYRVQAFRPLAP